jgi:hypothetical protein
MTAATALAAVPRFRPPSRIDEALRTARTCYDHLAGRLGVALAEGWLPGAISTGAPMAGC